MIIKEKKFIFKTVNVILEDEKFKEFLMSGNYGKVIGMSYDELPVDGCRLRKKTTALIRLNQDQDDIFSKFSSTTRNEIRRTFKIDDLSFKFFSKVNDESYSLYKRFEYSQGRVPTSRRNLDHCLLFAAYYKGEMISAIYVMDIKPYLRIRSIFSKRLEVEDRDVYKIIGYSTRRIVWDACLWGKKNGFVSLDMASVNLSNPKTLSISKFKMSFGGDIVNEYTYIYKTKVFALFEKMVRYRLLLLKLLNKFKKHLIKN